MTKRYGSQIVKASVNKIVQIGTGPSYLKYTVSKNDTMYVTSSDLPVRNLPDANAEKILTLKKDDEVKVLEIEKDWYKIEYTTYSGWVKKDCLTKNNPNQEQTANNNTYTASQLRSKLSFYMALNTPSGASLEQFEKLFENDSQDKNNVFKDNAKYFYYAEQQYNINGIFLASVAIHESAWGTSAMSKNKKNLFGYGAYDRDPSGNAYVFSSYSESIDLLARVFTKYYLNPKGTPIYNGETASGSHYNGANVTGVNKHYATDSNWKNAVYKWMKYLYNKM